MPPLELSPEEFRTLAQRITAVATDFVASLESGQTLSTTSGSDTTDAFDLPLPEDGIGDAILDDLSEIEKHVRAPTGRRLPYVLGSGEPIAALADFYSSVLNQNVTAWRSAPAAVTIERSVTHSLAEAIGCKGFVGSFTSGGSLANLMGSRWRASRVRRRTRLERTRALSTPRKRFTCRFPGRSRCSGSAVRT